LELKLPISRFERTSVGQTSKLDQLLHKNHSIQYKLSGNTLLTNQEFCVMDGSCCQYPRGKCSQRQANHSEYRRLLETEANQTDVIKMLLNFERIVDRLSAKKDMRF